MNFIYGKEVLGEDWEILKLQFIEKPKPEDGDAESACEYKYYRILI